MALAVKQDNCVEENRAPAEIVPMPKRGKESALEGAQQKVKNAAQEYVVRATDLVKKTKNATQKAYEQTREQTIRSYSRVIDRAQALGRQTQVRARKAKEERPIQLLATIAGAAFVLGITIRIWRSRAS